MSTQAPANWISTNIIPKGKTDQRREIHLLTKKHGLLAQDLTNQVAWTISDTGSDPLDFSFADSSFRLFDSAYKDREFNAGGSQDLISTLVTTKDGKINQSLDVGRMENIFWFDPQEVHAGSHSTWGIFPDGEYIKNSAYNFSGSGPVVVSIVEERKNRRAKLPGLDVEN